MDLEILRGRIASAIERATDLLADIRSIDDGLVAVLPTLAEMTERERATSVARLCGYDAALPERLRALVESLADVLAGLASTDAGRAWLAHRQAQLMAGDAEEAA